MKDRMRKENAVFAGEMSGHYYFRENFYADNGLIRSCSSSNTFQFPANPFRSDASIPRWTLHVGRAELQSGTCNK